jgi:hypothetical protein
MAEDEDDPTAPAEPPSSAPLSGPLDELVRLRKVANRSANPTFLKAAYLYYGRKLPRERETEAAVRRDQAIKDRLASGEHPGSNTSWQKFYDSIRDDCEAWVGDRKHGEFKRGFSNDHIKDIARELMKQTGR